MSTTAQDSLIESMRQGRASRRDFVKRGLALGLSAPLVAALAACGATATPTAAPAGSGSGQAKTGGRLVFGAWQDPDTLDPHTTGLAATSRILIHIFDPLVWKKPGEDKFYPGLAERWEISSDGKEYTFFLRKDVKFHNGEEFTAEAVKFSYDRIADPATKSLARSTLGPYSKTEVVDKYTAKVVFTEPYSPFLTYAGVVVSLRPVSPKAYKDLGTEVNVHPVGTGPFMYKEYTKQDHFTMVRNPDYTWGASFFDHQGAAYLDEILWKIVPEPSTRVSALDNGEVMVIEEVRPQDVVRYQDQKDKYYVQTTGTPGQPRMILINTAKAPTDDVAVRQACILATDQDTIVKTLYKGVYKPSHSLMDPLTPAYAKDLDGYYKFDLAKAKQTLEDAGWKAGPDGIRQKNGQRLHILFISNSANDFKNIAELMQATYKEAGIELEITFESQPSVFSTYNKGPQNFGDFFFWSPDPDQLKATYHSANIQTGFNWSHFNNPDFDKLVEQGAVESDLQKRTALYHKAQEILWQQAAAIPIQEKIALIVAQNKVKNVKFDSNAYPYYYDASLA
jgi:peptide/nickel transport system substrate-binding protein